MSRSRSLRRGRRFAALTAGSVVLATASFGAPLTSASSAADGPGLPAPSRADLPTGVASSRLGSRPSGVPESGRHAFLLKLDARSTGRVYALRSSDGRRTAASAARAQLDTVQSAQDAVVAELPARTPVLYRTHAVLSGVAVVTNAKNYDALAGIPGVAAVYPITPKSPDNGYAVPLQGGPAAWEGFGNLGAGTTVGIIDTGIDYTHANFGGPGTVAAYDAEHAIADDPTLTSTMFPTTKVVGGYDLVGDDYDADPASATYNPVPVADPNPLDCEGHGSHVAGTVAGLGENADGTTYDGDYDTSTPFSSLKIGPGMAPGASLMSFRVFGCTGSTDVTSAAIDRAMDPNNDGSTADAVDVINMSLGSDFGSPDDADAMTANAAADLGVTLSISSGNSYDLYDVGGSPGTAQQAITVAASVDAQSVADGLDVTFTPGGSDQFAASRSVAYDWANDPDLAGEIVDLGPEVTGCTAFTPEQSALIAGKIPILKWTDDDLECGSVTRSGNVVAAGGVGFVFASNKEAFSAGITGSAVIPGVLVNLSGGQAIRDAIAGDATAVVDGTEANAVTQTFPDDDDTLTDFSSRGTRGAGHLKPDVTAVGATVFSTAVGTGNDGVTESGTSMAAPMVAGLAALVVAQNPGWTPEQVKADIMNTAGQDIDTNGSATAGGDRYAPNRVGAGRIQAEPALANEVLAYGTDDPGAVSVSFGPLEVTKPITRSKTVRVQNTGSTSRTYDTSYDEITSIPGVQYDISPAQVTVAGGASTFVTVTLSVDPSALTKTVDVTHGRGDADLPLESLADASGNLLLTPTSGSQPELRVPVYSAPRPASTMTQASSLDLVDGEGTLALSGKGVDQGTDEEAVRSLAAGLELQATSPPAPECSSIRTSMCVSVPDERGADLKYVGVTSDAPYQATASNGQAYFGITTQGAHSTAAGKVEFDIYLDVDRDGAADLVAYNTRVADSDAFLTEVVDLATGEVVDDEVTNNRLGDVDTAIFDSDTLLMPVWLKPLLDYGVDATSPRVNYAIATYSSSTYTGGIDSIGFGADGEPNGTLSANLYEPGVLVSGEGVTGDAWGANTEFGPLVEDQPGDELTVVRNPDSYAADKGLGVMMVHFHNEVGKKTQIVSLGTVAPTVTLTAAPSSLVRGQTTKLKITVADPEELGTPSGSVQVTDSLTSKPVGTATLKGGSATISYRPTAVGSHHLVATYTGSPSYSQAESAQVLLKVTKTKPTVTLSMPKSGRAGKPVRATVVVSTVLGVPATGKVELVAGGKTIGKGTLVKGRTTISFTPKNADVGKLKIRAVYAGDSSYLGGASVRWPRLPVVTLPFDPIDEAARQWGKHWEGVPAMHAVTSLMRVQQLVIGRLDAILKPHGLSFARYEALVLLTFSSRGSLPLGKMGERLQVHPTSVTSIVRRLEAAGLVERKAHPDDGRAVLAEITDTGRALVEVATRDLVAADFALSALSDADLAKISTVLTPVRKAAGDF